MTYQGADELKLVRGRMPEWSGAVAEVADESSASSFSSVVGGMFRTAVYDERLTADENWNAFLVVMYAKVETLRNFGFSFDAVLASRMCTSEERAFAAMHAVDDLMGKRGIMRSSGIAGYIEREKAATAPGDAVSYNANLSAAAAMARYFDIDPKLSEVIQECTEVLHTAFNEPRDALVEQRLEALQRIYLDDRTALRDAMWQCISAITPVWQIGDEVRTGTIPETCADVLDVLEPELRAAFDAVHRLGRSDDDSLRWATFLQEMSRSIRSARTDLDAVSLVINGADDDLVSDPRVTVALQRLARAGADIEHACQVMPRA
jgi:hypothetical protein